MAARTSTAAKAKPPRWYSGADVPMSVIRKVVRQIGEQFAPEQVILFGSFAYGKPHQDSDVDLLVVMPARNQIDQAVKISLAIDPPFPVDIIVRTPRNMEWRLKAGDSFLGEIVSNGRVLNGHRRGA